jgi:hypothetical protein
MYSPQTQGEHIYLCNRSPFGPTQEAEICPPLLFPVLLIVLLLRPGVSAAPPAR